MVCSRQLNHAAASCCDRELKDPIPFLLGVDCRLNSVRFESRVEREFPAVISAKTWFSYHSVGENYKAQFTKHPAF